LQPEVLLQTGPPPGPPYFPAPVSIRSRREAPEHDILLIADMNDTDDATGAELLAAAIASGSRVALLHYPDVDSDFVRPLDPHVRGMAGQRSVRIVAFGESVKTREVVVVHPRVFRAAIDRFPKVERETLVVLAHPEAGAGAADGGLPVAVRANLRALLGGEGAWMSPGEWTKRLNARRGQRPPEVRAVGSAPP
jgi:hypothetical protein